jgi:hypothetical protein
VWSDTDLGSIGPIDTRHSFLCLYDGEKERDRVREEGREGGEREGEKERKRECILMSPSPSVYSKKVSMKSKFQMANLLFPPFLLRYEKREDGKEGRGWKRGGKIRRVALEVPNSRFLPFLYV